MVGGIGKMITLILWLMTGVFFSLWYINDQSVGRNGKVHIGWRRRR